MPDARFAPIFQLLAQRDHQAVLSSLEALRDDLLASEDKFDRSTYLQTFASALDGVGRSAEALAPAREALAIDQAIDPAGVGTYLSMRSLIIILERTGARAEAQQHFAKLLELGEALGAMYFAGAIMLARGRVDDARLRTLWSRGHFQCEVALRENRPIGHQLLQLAGSYASLTHELAAAQTAEGTPDRAKQILGATIATLEPIAKQLPSLETKLAALRAQLAKFTVS